MASVIVENILDPDPPAGLEIEAIEDPHPAERDHFVARNGRRCSRSFAGDRREVAGLVRVSPEHLGGEQIIANDRFFLAALLLCDRAMAGDRKTGPRGADRLPPELLRRLGRPVARELGT